MSSALQPSVTLTARWLFPIDRPAIADGLLTISGGHIVAVEPGGSREADFDLGNCALLPGLVNAHTHLDLSGLRGRTPPSSDFVSWLRQVIGQRRVQTPVEVQADIQAGLTESLDSGTTLIGDIAAGGQSWDLLAQAPCRSVVFYELLGLSKPRAHTCWANATSWLRTRPNLYRCRPGLSPHAPYSVRASLFRAAKQYAGSRTLAVAIHTAESLAELELIAHQSGPMVPFLRDLGVFDAAGLIKNLDELTGAADPNLQQLLVHGNYLQADWLQGHCASVVYCPRTHHAFGHSRYPLADFLRAGVRIALGSDSLASNPDLSLFREAQFVHRHHPEVMPADILRMATLNGAAALGWDNECGSLTIGKAADLAVIELPDREEADPAALVLDYNSHVTGVMIAGAWYKQP